MNETAADLTRLQRLLDQSHERAGAHLLSIITPERRLSAVQVAERLQGMCLLTLATVTADGRPLAAPVDGLFHRGRFHFGSSPDSVRFRHVRERPWVSATHVPGEHLAVTVHGTARELGTVTDLDDDLQDAYVGIYGEEWRHWHPGAVYAVIEPDRMFTFHLEPAVSAA